MTMCTTSRGTGYGSSPLGGLLQVPPTLARQLQQAAAECMTTPTAVALAILTAALRDGLTDHLHELITKACND